MLIPLRDSIRLARLPLVTIALIVANVIAYLLAIRGGGSIVGGPTADTLVHYGAIPYEFTHTSSHCDLAANGFVTNVICSGQPGADLRLAALASGPRDDAVAVLEQAPRAARGFDATHQAILAARSAGGRVAFETPVQLAPAALNSAPSVAIDPASDRAVVAWQMTPAGGVPQIAYAVRATP